MLVLRACAPADTKLPPAATQSVATPGTTVADPVTSPPQTGVALQPDPGPFEIPPAVVLPADGGRTRGKWCTEFGDYQLSLGDTVTLAWADGRGSRPSFVAVVTKVRPGKPCLFYGMDEEGLPDRDDDESYELTPAEPITGDMGSIRPGFAVWGRVRWTRVADRLLRGDVDGDGVPELARACSTREAVVMTVWSELHDSPTSKPREVRRWKRYQPLGFDDVPNCTEREQADDPEPQAS